MMTDRSLLGGVGRLGLLGAVLALLCLAVACEERGDASDAGPRGTDGGPVDTPEEDAAVGTGEDAAVEAGPDAGLDAAPDGGVRRGIYALGEFTVEVNGVSVVIAHRDAPEREIWASVPGDPFLRAAAADATIREQRGSFTIDEKVTAVCDEQRIDRVESDGDRLTLSGALLGDGCAAGYSATFAAATEERLELDVTLEPEAGGVNRLFLVYRSEPEERFVGFGEQFTHLNLKGRRVPILTQEQGIGRGRQPITDLTNTASPGSGGDWSTTYLAVPHYLTDRGRSLALRNTEVSYFDLREPDRVEVEIFAVELAANIYYGAEPLDLVAAHAEAFGRMEPLPDWVNRGIVLGLQGGTDRVRGILDAVDVRGTPLAAVWIQDWVGRRKTLLGSQLWWNWELDTARYAGFEAFAGELKARGVELLAYLNPFLVDASGKPGVRRNLFDEARDAGFLVKNEAGGVYLIANTDFGAALLDLTHAGARAWFEEVVTAQVLALGFSGWMADFSEALPFDAVLADGDAPALHNAYPVLWAQLNRDILARNGLEGEALFFTRSGYTDSPAVSTLFWTGDQLVTWDGKDGFRSAVKAILSAGLSGFAYNHSDIGGYTTVSLVVLDHHRSQELLLRWLEANAFTAVLRSHEGLQPENNVQLYSNEATLAHLDTFTRIFVALADYRVALAEEVTRRGTPIVRHMLLHFPEDPRAWEIDDQWMLGADFLVAPVVEAGAAQRRVYLPAGAWVHLWSGEQHGDPAAGTTVTVEAPLGRPPVFYPEGSAAGQALAHTFKKTISVQHLCN